MTALADPTEIETIVGVARDDTLHFGRAVSAERTVYILHSRACRDSGRDLRECRYSVALDKGINPQAWRPFEDRAVVLAILASGHLAPIHAWPLRGGEDA